MDLPVAGAQLHFQVDRFAVVARGLEDLVALLRVDPQAQFDGGLVDNLVAGPAEDLFKVLVDLVDQAVGAASQQDDIGAQVKQRGKALFRVDQCGFAFALAGNLANHADHLWAAGLALAQAAVDLQPVQAAVRPADPVTHGLLDRLAR
ncbi:hypothetical protein D9M71_282970 [compost metagenome]